MIGDVQRGWVLFFADGLASVDCVCFGVWFGRFALV